MSDLRDMTTGEAAAWRAGWEAARAAAADSAIAAIAIDCRCGAREPTCATCLKVQTIAEAIDAMEAPR